MPRKTRNKKVIKVMESEVVVDITKPEKFKLSEVHAEKEVAIPKPRYNRKIWWVILLVFAIMISGIGLCLWWYTNSFTASSQTDTQILFSTLSDGLRTDPFRSAGNVSVVVLGLDKVENRKGSLPLSDTMLVATARPDGKIYLTSIPRDLWIDQLEAKVNALYALGQQNNPPSGVTLVKSAISAITGLQVDYVVVTTVESLKQTVDLLGGVEVDVIKGFTDEEYPRDDVDISSKDPKVLYETISFQPGKQTFTGEMTIKYIRSRHSKDLEVGNDMARTVRQQEVIKAIVDKVIDRRVYLNPVIMGRMYLIWKSWVQTEMPDAVIIGLLRNYLGKKVEINRLALTVQSANSSGLIKTNPKNKDGQWVYEPVDPSWLEFHNFFIQTIR